MGSTQTTHSHQDSLSTFIMPRHMDTFINFIHTSLKNHTITTGMTIYIRPVFPKYSLEKQPKKLDLTAN